MSVNDMKRDATAADEMRREYDFDYSKAVRGKYYKRLFKEGSNVIVLEPDVAKAFPTSAAVNDALRVVIKAANAARPRTARTGGRSTKRRVA
jgi:hypothetical protein